MQTFVIKLVTTTTLIVGLLIQSSALANGIGLRWCHNHDKICKGEHSTTTCCGTASAQQPAPTCCAGAVATQSCCSKEAYHQKSGCHCCSDLPDPPVTPTSRPVELAGSLLLVSHLDLPFEIQSNSFAPPLEARPPPLCDQAVLCVWLN